MLYPMNWSSLQVGTEPRAWIASTSNRRTFRSVFSRSEPPTNVQPSNRLSRNRISAHTTNSKIAPRWAREVCRPRPGPGGPGVDGDLGGPAGRPRSGDDGALG